MCTRVYTHAHRAKIKQGEGRMKTSARLIKAFIALVVSCVLCIAVCLAWFAQNEKVDANGMQSMVFDGDIQDFTVTAYRLVKVNENDNTNFKVHSKYDEGSAVEMPAYGKLDDPSIPYTTAVLLEVTFNGNDKNYTIRADCNTKYGFFGPAVADTFNCYLSDAVEIFKTVTVAKDGENVVCGTATVSGAGEKFTYEETETVNGETKTVTKKQNMTLVENYSGSSGAFYYIINYSEENITKLYQLAADNGGGISSAINFNFGSNGEKDIVFYIQEA